MRQGFKLLAVVLAGLVLAPAAVAQTKLRYKFKEGQKLEYVVDQKTVASFGGMDVKTGMKFDMVWQTLKVDEAGKAQVKVVINRAR